MKKIKVLSLFDGLAGARIALDKLNIPCNYYASEIDKYAVKIAMKNYPDIIQLGDITKLGKEIPYPKEIINGVDLIIFGSPCQNLSINKKNREGLEGEQSKLFYEAVKIMKDIPHKYFLMENVKSMSKENKQIITNILSEFIFSQEQWDGILINSAKLTAQNRRRIYWTNIKGIKQPKDKGIYLKDILEKEVDKKYYIKNINEITMYTNKNNIYKTIRVGKINKGGQGNRIYSIEGKSVSLSAKKTGLYLINSKMQNYIRKLTPLECERLQSIPEGYTEGISDSQRYKMIGNGFTCDVIVWILSVILNSKKEII